MTQSGWLSAVYEPVPCTNRQLFTLGSYLRGIILNARYSTPLDRRLALTSGSWSKPEPGRQHHLLSCGDDE